MSVTSKLRLIQEGFSIGEINSGEAKSFSSINESADELQLFIESVAVDFSYVSQMSMNILKESDGDKTSVLRKFINWILEKIRQFKTFIMHMFQKKKHETHIQTTSSLKKIMSKEFHPFMVPDNFDMIVNDPNAAMTVLKNLVGKFEDVNADYVDYAYTGAGYNSEITSSTDVNGMQSIIWRKVLNGAPISYDKNVTPNALDLSLNKSAAVRIQSKEQIQNIIIFTDSFYDLWKDMHQALGYYETQIENLSAMADDSFKIIQLLCETMLHTYPEILSYVNAHINKLTMIEKYM
jgi:hypothetical protein